MSAGSTCGHTASHDLNCCVVKLQSQEIPKSHPGRSHAKPYLNQFRILNFGHCFNLPLTGCLWQVFIEGNKKKSLNLDKQRQRSRSFLEIKKFRRRLWSHDLVNPWTPGLLLYIKGTIASFSEWSKCHKSMWSIWTIIKYLKVVINVKTKRSSMVTIWHKGRNNWDKKAQKI